MGDIKEAIENVLKNKKDAKKDRDGKPVAGQPFSHLRLTYDSNANQIEPIYFWILDFMQNDLGLKVEKVSDNYRASPGSGQFADMGQKMSQMHQKGGEYILGINQVTKGILQLIYDLKEFEIRLGHYDDAKSEDKIKKEAGMLALKQTWLDNVDLKRGVGAIHQMAAQGGYTTVREIFMMANSPEDVDKMEKNDEGIINSQVARIVKPRISEFLKWKEYSEQELRKRFNIEKNYLKTQVETLKLYAAWAKPYLKAAKDLQMKGFDKDPALVNAFSTTMFELTLLGKKEVKPSQPFEKYNLKRKYYSGTVVTIRFRGALGQKVDQRGNYGFAFGGRVDMDFGSYALNEQELKLVEKEMAKQDLDNGLDFVTSGVEDSLDQLKDDIEHFTGDDPLKHKEKKVEEKKDESSPFTALFGNFFKKKDEKKKEIEGAKDIEKDNYVEEHVRAEAETGGKKNTYLVYDIYKKAHQMASSPEDFEN